MKNKPKNHAQNTEKEESAEIKENEEREMKREENTAREEKERNAEKPEALTIIIPTVKELSKDEIIEIYKEEIRKKDSIICDLQNENKLLLDLTMKNAKRKLEELGNIFQDENKKNN